MEVPFDYAQNHANASPVDWAMALGFELNDQRWIILDESAGMPLPGSRRQWSKL